MAMRVSRVNNELYSGVIPLLFQKDVYLERSEFIERICSRKLSWIFDDWQILDHQAKYFLDKDVLDDCDQQSDAEYSDDDYQAMEV